MTLITKAQVVDRAMTNANFDTHLIKDTFIDISELNHLKPFLGCDLYDTISEESNDGVVWTNATTDQYIITCTADVSGDLDLDYIALYSTNDENKYAVFFQINDATTIISTPIGYTGVIAVNLTTSGQNSTAAEVGNALNTALNAHPDFFAANDGAGVVTVYGITGTSPALGATAGFGVVATTSNGGYNVDEGDVDIDCNNTNFFIQVGDFVSGIGIQNNTQVVAVDDEGDVNAFTISKTPTSTNSTASLTFRRPNGVLKQDYIVDYLAFCVKFEILPDITYNTTSQGVVDNIADFTSPVNEKKLNYLRQETYKKSETFKKKMHLFLDKHSSSYPEWNGCGGCGSCGTGGSSVRKRHGIITY